ncbi:hypothetical protein NMG60_11033913 [Bertholletia excelsa]
MKNGGKNLVELHTDACEQKGVKSITLAEAQGLGLSQEDKSRINEAAGEINNGPEEATPVSSGPEKLQPQGSVIHWERFLPIRSLKVLLVENDDSTRHVVNALLRNCSYEVIAVENGLKAWKILEDLNNHIDIVLTEVVMPVLSGIKLLYNIMSHKTLKNIPVIMMSSHDSMSLVFRCLSKGAVDFLVKPIRKNELKNLWQHVWRRCHSSSGSGSESGTQTKRSAKIKGNDESDNNTDSSEEQDNGSIARNIRDGSDNGSGTQSSWTKRATEVDSPQPISPMNQLADAPDSTCAQVIHTKPETSSSMWVHFTETKECEEQDKLEMEENLEESIARESEQKLVYWNKLSTQPSSKRHTTMSELNCLSGEKEKQEYRSDNMSGKHRDCAIESSAISSCTKPRAENRAFEAPRRLFDTSRIKDKASSDFKALPSLELTFERLPQVGDVGRNAHCNRNVWRHSDLSAFSKYNTAFSTNQAPTGNIGSSSLLDNSSVAMKTEAVNSSNAPNQQSNESCNNSDMSSTAKYLLKPEALSNKSESISAFKRIHTSAFQPLLNGRVCTTQEVKRGKVGDTAVFENEPQLSGSKQQVQVQHQHYHYHYHHHHVHNVQHQPQQDHDDVLLNSMAAIVPQCGSTNVLGGSVEGTGGNYSVNGSASGSNHASNMQNGSSKAVNAGVPNMDSENGVAKKSEIVGTSERVGGNQADENRFAKREAALTKFRQKRKERCFEKKVRYQSRKRLAEQRPRIRGQFVRQIVSDVKAGKDAEDNISLEENSSQSIQ